MQPLRCVPPQNLKVQTHERQAREDRKNYGQRRDEKYHRGEHRNLLLTGCFHQLALSRILSLRATSARGVPRSITQQQYHPQPSDNAGTQYSPQTPATLSSLKRRCGSAPNLRKLTSQLARGRSNRYVPKPPLRLRRRHHWRHHLRQRRELSNQPLLTLTTRPPVTRQKAAQTARQHPAQEHQDGETLLHHANGGQRS